MTTAWVLTPCVLWDQPRDTVHVYRYTTRRQSNILGFPYHDFSLYPSGLSALAL